MISTRALLNAIAIFFSIAMIALALLLALYTLAAIVSIIAAFLSTATHPTP